MAKDFIPGRPEPATPSNTFLYFFREASRRIWVSKRTSFVAIAMIAISLFTVGAFLLVSENLSRAIAQWQGRSRMNVYFTTGATAEQIRAVDSVLGSTPELRRRRFVSPAEALVTFKADFPALADVADRLHNDPLPASYQIDVEEASSRTPSFRNAAVKLRAMEGVDEVQFDWEWLGRLRRTVDAINIAGLIAGGVLALAAAFTIANVIKLTMLLYREEIEIMRLVGATERIIRGPFLIEGLLQGAIGSVVAVSLLFGTFALAQRNLGPSRSLLWGFLFATFLPWQKLLALGAGGVAAGWIGSWMSVRERSTG